MSDKASKHHSLAFRVLGILRPRGGGTSGGLKALQTDHRSSFWGLEGKKEYLLYRNNRKENGNY